MKLKIFTAYDSKVEAYMQPFFMRSRGEALRAWTELANNPEHTFAKHPADYTLFEIGEFDDSTGKTTSLSAYTNLGTALEFKRPSDDTQNVPTLLKQPEQLQLTQ